KDPRTARPCWPWWPQESILPCWMSVRRPSARSLRLCPTPAGRACTHKDIRFIDRCTLRCAKSPACFEEDMNFWRQIVKQPQRVWLRRAVFQVHLWTGIGVGLYVFVISVSGSAIVFRNEVYRDFAAKPVIVEPSGNRMTILELIAFTRRSHAGYDVGLVYENAKNPNQAVEITFERGGSRRPRLFDPYTGRDLGASVPTAIRLASWLADLHVNLLYDRPGRVVNAVGGGLVALLGLTGAVMWWL